MEDALSSCGEVKYRWHFLVISMKAALMGWSKRFARTAPVVWRMELGHETIIYMHSHKNPRTACPGICGDTDIQLKTLRRSLEVFNMKINMRRDYVIFQIKNHISATSKGGAFQFKLK